MEPSLFNVLHSTNTNTSKLEFHNSLQPHFMHMYFNMELLPIPAGACTVITVGRGGMDLGTDQQVPNISSILTLSMEFKSPPGLEK